MDVQNSSVSHATELCALAPERFAEVELRKETPWRASNTNDPRTEQVVEDITEFSSSFQTQGTPMHASAFVAEVLWTNRNRSRASAINAGIDPWDTVMSY
jgi:hypothetical protein